MFALKSSNRFLVSAFDEAAAIFFLVIVGVVVSASMGGFVSASTGVVVSASIDGVVSTSIGGVVESASVGSGVDSASIMDEVLGADCASADSRSTVGV